MEALAALGVASNVIQLVESGAKLFGLIKEYSSHLGAPKELVAVSKRLELTIQVLRSLDDGGKIAITHESGTMNLCLEQLKDLTEFIERLSLNGNGPSTGQRSRFGILARRKSQSLEKTMKALTAMRSMEKFRQLQTSLDRLLNLIGLEQQNRVVATTNEIRERSERSERTLYNTQEMIRGLQQVHLIGSQPQSAVQSEMRESLEVFMVPLPRNEDFISRHEIFTRLDAIFNFSKDFKTDRSRVIRNTALCGLGGIGKSQIALEFAYRQHEKIPTMSIFWLHSSTPARFEEAYKQLAAVFNIPGCADDRLDPLQLVRDFLEFQYSLPWLMIVDNVDDSRMFEPLPRGKSPYEYIPRTGSGSILYTSRNRDVSIDLVKEPIMVPPMPKEDARQLLRNLIASSNSLGEEDELLMEIDYLPLAINQAASFMLKRRMKISQYLHILRNSENDRLKLLEFSFLDSGRESTNFSSIAATWFVSFSQIRSDNPKAASLLLFMSFFDRQDIPEALLISESESSFEFCEAIGILESYSFIQTNEAGDGFTIHRLVHVISKAWLRNHERNQFSVLQFKALQNIANRFPRGDFEDWSTCARYLPHAETILSVLALDESEEYHLQVAKVLCRTGYYQAKRQEFQQAQVKISKCLNIYNDMGLSDCPEALEASSIKGLLLDVFNDDFTSARAVLTHTFERQESILGFDHLDTLETLSRLINVLRALRSDLVYVETMCRRLISARAAIHGPEHHLALDAQISLGDSLNEMSRFREAESLLRECISHPSLTSQRSPNPHTVSAYSALALTLGSQGREAEAVELLRIALASSILIFGKTSFISLNLQVDLCDTLRETGKLDEAEKLAREILPLCEDMLGGDRLITVFCVRSLAEILRDQERYDEEQSLLREHIRRRGINVDNSIKLPSNAAVSVALLVGYLGDAYDWDGKCHEAKELLEQVWLWSRERRGYKDPRTLEWLNGLADILDRVRDFEGAEKVARDVVALRDEVFGKHHATTLSSKHLLARILLNQGQQGKLEEAKSLLDGIIARRIEYFGLDNYMTANSVQLLGEVCAKQNEDIAAENHFRTAARVRESLKGGQTRSADKSWDHVAASLQKQHRWAEALDIWQRLLDSKRNSVAESLETLRLAGNVAAMYYKIDRRSEEARVCLEDVAKRSRDYYLSQRLLHNTADAEDAIDREVFSYAFSYGWLHPTTRSTRLEHFDYLVECGMLKKAEDTILETFDHTGYFLELARKEMAKTYGVIDYWMDSEIEFGSDGIDYMTEGWNEMYKDFYDKDLEDLQSSLKQSMLGKDRLRVRDLLVDLFDYWNAYESPEVVRWNELKSKVVAFYTENGKHEEAAAIEARETPDDESMWLSESSLSEIGSLDEELASFGIDSADELAVGSS